MEWAHLCQGGQGSKQEGVEDLRMRLLKRDGQLADVKMILEYESEHVACARTKGTIVRKPRVQKGMLECRALVTPHPHHGDGRLSR